MQKKHSNGLPESVTGVPVPGVSPLRSADPAPAPADTAGMTG